ncbi:MAG: nicotinate-nicotinamide nucleotide adenylyltransferase [Thermoleophilia bacterium]|nr:nicotinate-nicotinamide nucleotide adenylyltransferase [Thermoleophilia bacterium]
MTAISADLPVRQGTYRLGVFGSMMNPPHLGHLAVVDAVHAECGLDRVVVVPSGVPPHRSAPTVSARARLTMAVRAFADVEHAVVSDTEVERGEHGEPGYMIDTVEEVLELPSLLGYDDLVVEASLVVGADQAATLTSWHRWEELLALARLVVVRRPDQLGDATLAAALEDLATRGIAGMRVVDMPSVPISSTQVRAVAATRDRPAVAQLVPGAIVDDVLRLYGPS